MSKEKSANSYLKNFATLFTGNSIGQLFPFLFAPIIARIFSPMQMGLFESFLTIVSLISIIGAARYEVALVLPENEKKSNNLLALTLIIGGIITLLSILISIFPQPIHYFFPKNNFEHLLNYIAPMVLLTTLNNILVQWVIRKGAYNYISIARIVQSVFQNGLYALLGFWGWGLNGLIVGLLMGNLLSNLVLLLPSWSMFKFNLVNRADIKNVAVTYKDFPLVNSFHAFTDIVATQFLLFSLLSGNYGATQLGLFALMNRYLRAPLGLISGTVSQLYYREASSLKNNKQSLKALFNKSQGIILLFLIPVIIVIVGWGPQLFTLYLGNQWTLSGNYARVMLPAVILNFLCSTVSSTPLIFERQKTAYLFSLIGYTMSLSSIVLCAYLKFDFSIMLWCYSIVLSIYYLALFIWYRIIINKFERDVHTV